VRALKVALDDGFEAQHPVLKEMRTLYPEDKEMLFGLGDAEFHSGQYDSAAVHFRAALAIDPVMERALQHPSWTLLRQERYEEALVVSERWAKATRATESFENIAMANLRLGRPDDALQVLAEARERDPKNSKLLLNEALVRFATHHPYEALATVEEADHLGDPDPLARLGSVQMRAMVLYPYLGRFRDSARLLSDARAVAMSTFHDSTSVVNLALAERVIGYWGHQDAKKTIAELNDLSSVRKKYLSDDYYRSLSMFSLIVGDTARARNLLQGHTKHMTATQRQTFHVFEVAATGDCARAAELFAAAVKSKEFPVSAQDPLNYMLARCQLANGAYDDAIASLRRIVDREFYFAESAPMIPVAWFFLGEAYERDGDVARATAAYERVLELWKGGDADLYCRREARLRLDRLAGTRSM
jgi:tetratricopeptide (TPR) repeat protein